jgi:hypothetical protein
LRIRGFGRTAFGEHPPELGKYLCKVRRSLAEVGSELLRRERSNERPQRLKPRPVSRGAARLPAAAPEDSGALSARLLSDLVGKSALPDSRLAREKHEPPLITERVAKR